MKQKELLLMNVMLGYKMSKSEPILAFFFFVRSKVLWKRCAHQLLKQNTQLLA